MVSNQIMNFVARSALFIGCAAALHAGDSAPTFSRDVWPIMERHCVTCHQPGEIGPMAFTSYAQVRPWAAAIGEAVATRAMPPWHAAPGTHAFRNDRTLSEQERVTLASWVRAGAPEGNPIAPYRKPEITNGWKLGKPDIVVEVPGFAVPKSGLLPYSFLIVPLHLEHDTWVSAAEFQIDQRAVIHHMNAFIRPASSSYLAGFASNQIFIPTVAERGKRREGEKVFDRRELLLGYEPGYEPRPWLENGAKLIPAGSDLVLEMHYSPNGKETTDHSKIALYFAKTPPEKRVLAIDTLRDLDLTIAPNQPDQLSKASMVLAGPASLLSVQPHMHMRGKSMEVTVIYPDGRKDCLVNVPHYDFGWQTTYVFMDPLPLPAGTRLESSAHFDNSPNNRFNPDPTACVRWGDQTTDEMHIAFLELVIDAKANAETLFRESPRMIR
jgi:mono/diheme cytochrome c family protein